MKNLIKLFAVVILILQWSCQNEDRLDPTAGDPPLSAVIMEMELHQTTVDEYILLNEEQHAEFMSAELRSLIKVKSVPGNKVRSFDETDTIFSYHEIPLIKETKTNFLIFEDGSSEMLHEDITPDGINPLYTLTETPPGDDMILSRTHLKEGRLKVYDRNNALLVDESYPEENMKSFVDSVLNLVSSTNNPQKIGVAADVSLPGITTIRLSDGTVQLEQYLSSMPTVASAIAGSEPIKAVAQMNEDMNKTLKFELYSGHQLIHRKKFEYDDTVLLKNFIDGKEVSANPHRIESETIQLSDEGIPVVYTTTTVYHRNQIRFTVTKEGVEQNKL